MFFHVNSYKMVITGVLFTAFFLLYQFLPALRKGSTAFSWKLLLIFLLPVIGTLPGTIVHGLSVNYYFTYEMAALLIVSLWAATMNQRLENEEDQKGLLIWIGVTILLTSLWSYLERVGMNPFIDSNIPVGRVKATFGNINYYAGFLLILAPVFLALSVPSFNKEKTSIFDQFGKKHLFFLITFLAALISLYLTQTRAALAGEALGLGLAVFLITLIYLPKKYQKTVFFSAVGLVILIIAGIYFHVSSLENLENDRIGQLFSTKVWEGRLVPWRTAIASVKDSLFTGYGLGSSYNLFFEYIDPSSRLYWAERSYNHAHSEFLEYLQEGGIFGYLCWLGFWGLTVFQLIKTIIKKETTDFRKQLAIGILGGLTAYLFHSIFSVAPRMMVVRLPLYTAFGLAWLISAHPFKSNGEPLKKLDLQAIIPGVLILVLFWGLFYPGVSSQARQIEFMSSSKGSSKTIQMEKAFTNSSNIYALDYLLHQQLKYKRFSQAEKTVQQIQKTIPHFRTIGHFDAILDFYKGDLSSAKTKALEYQKRDLYYPYSNMLLMRIAALEGNGSDFIRNFAMHSRYLIVSSKIDGIENPEDIQAVIQENPGGIDFIKTEDKLRIHLSPKFISYVLSEIKFMNQLGRIQNVQLNRFMQTIGQALSKNHYFQFKAKPELSMGQKEKVLSTFQQYLRAKNQLVQKMETLQKSFDRKVHLISSSQRSEFEKKHRDDIAKLNEDFEKGTQPALTFLLKNSNWKQFSIRRQLFNSYMDLFNRLAVPAS